MSPRHGDFEDKVDSLPARLLLTALKQIRRVTWNFSKIVAAQLE
jgi:hypothetical protein